MFIKSRKHIVGRDAIIEFHKANKVTNRSAERVMEQLDRDFVCKEDLNVPGYCHVAPMAEFQFHTPTSEWEREPEMWVFDHVATVLVIDATGEAFYLRQDKKMHYLTPVERIISQRNRYFETTAKRPNLFSKMTQKKVETWVNYWHQYESELQSYLDGAMLRNKSFFGKLKEKFPEGLPGNWNRYTTDKDGWTSRAVIKWKGFEVTFDAYEDGGVGRQFSIIYNELPTNEEILGMA